MNTDERAPILPSQNDIFTPNNSRPNMGLAAEGESRQTTFGKDVIRKNNDTQQNSNFPVNYGSLVRTYPDIDRSSQSPADVRNNSNTDLSEPKLTCYLWSIMSKRTFIVGYITCYMLGALLVIGACSNNLYDLATSSNLEIYQWTVYVVLSCIYLPLAAVSLGVHNVGLYGIFKKNHRILLNYMVMYITYVVPLFITNIIGAVLLHSTGVKRTYLMFAEILPEIYYCVIVYNYYKYLKAHRETYEGRALTEE